MDLKKYLTGFLVLGVGWSVPVRAEGPVDRFVYGYLAYGEGSDPYPTVWPVLAEILRRTTRLDPWKERRMLTLDDPRLFETPFLVIMGHREVSLSKDQLEILRRYVSGGGFLFLDNSDAVVGNAFDRSIHQWVRDLLGEEGLREIPRDHALRKSFFLLRGEGGRRWSHTAWGLWYRDRLVGVYCVNDLQGALARDAQGHPLYACDPGGETQREYSLKWWVNIVIYSLTGTYKTDAIHQPFLERKGSTR